jgi:hypothetical protein
LTHAKREGNLYNLPFFQVNFTDLVKFETFDRDQEHILKKSGTRDLVKIEKRRTYGHPRSSRKWTQSYIDQLSPDLFQKIVNLYLLDFKIFDYSLPVQTKF